jgi:aspartyl-tRNA(Asn)/glutamyl-tRNA(Gln) amidotransferase subunit A
VSGPGELALLDAAALRERYMRRELSPVEAVEAALARIERLDGGLRAFVTVTGERALAEAREAESAYRQVTGWQERPLLGIPCSLKDLTPTAGIRTARGSLRYADAVPERDTPVAERLRGAGGALLGKTATPELGWKGASTSPLSGTTRSPWRPSASPGGSSGGAAVAVATGMGTVAQGSDGAGSVRIPAALCGVVGLKPTRSRVPLVPPSALAPLSHVGALARSVADAALLIDALSGPHVRDALSFGHPSRPLSAGLCAAPRSLRVGFSADLGYAHPDPAPVERAREAAFALRELGWQVDEVDVGLADPFPIVDVIWAAGMAAQHPADDEALEQVVDPGLLELVRRGREIPARALVEAQLGLAAFGEQVAERTAGLDLLATATLPVVSFPAEDDFPRLVGGRETSYLGWTCFTYPFNLTGQPAISLPCGLVDGLPVGLQLVARPRHDHLLVRAAAAFGRLRPWPQPPV